MSVASSVMPLCQGGILVWIHEAMSGIGAGQLWTRVLPKDQLWWLPYSSYFVFPICDIVPIVQIGKQRLSGDLPRVIELWNDRAGPGSVFLHFYHTTCYFFKGQYFYFLQLLCFYFYLKCMYTCFFWQCYWCYDYYFFLIIYEMLQMPSVL